MRRGNGPGRARVARRLLGLALALGLVGAPALAQPPALAAEEHTVSAGSESADKLAQVNQFGPQAISIHVGDTVTWTLGSTEFHTVTFLSGAEMPPFIAPLEGGPAIEPLAAFPSGDATYDGTGIRSSGLLSRGQTERYSLTFTQPGTFGYVCIVHPQMVGTVTVEEAGAPIDAPDVVAAHATAESNQALGTHALALALAPRTSAPPAEGAAAPNFAVAAGEGDGSVALMTYLPGHITVYTGDTVTWNNPDPVTPHTVTFLAGAEPPAVVVPEPQTDGPPILRLNPLVVQPQGGDSREFDGTAFTSSGMIGGDSPGPKQYSLSFTAPGTYEYVCLLHLDMGMRGTITVLPDTAAAPTDETAPPAEGAPTEAPAG